MKSPDFTSAGSPMLKVYDTFASPTFNEEMTGIEICVKGAATDIVSAVLVSP